MSERPPRRGEKRRSGSIARAQPDALMASVRVEFDVPATMRDGTVLRANVYRPDGDGPHPVLLNRTPYGKDLHGAGAVLDPVLAARRGYIVVIQDARGRFASDGEWRPFVHEADDGTDTIAWAAALPGGSGRVGMFGASYHGFTQWVAALGRPAGLAALAPFITWSEPLDGLLFRGGALELGAAAYWQAVTGVSDVLRRAKDPAERDRALAALVRDIDALAEHGYRTLPLRGFAPLRRHGLADAFFDLLESPLDRSRSAVVRVADRQAAAGIPALVTGGWYDLFLGGTLRSYRALRAAGVAAKLVIGPWSHGSQTSRVGERTFGFASGAGFIDLRTDLMSMQLRWFDQWLRGIDTGITREPPVKIFVMGSNVWRDEDDWPLARAVETPWHLRADGALAPARPGEEAPDSYPYDPADPTPTRGGALLMAPEYPAGPYDQREVESRPDVLTFTSAPLERDLEVTGPVRVHLWAASSAPDTDFVARLCDVFPDGRSMSVCDGIVRARFRDGVTATPLVPGWPYELVIDLWSTSNVFVAGHRIRLSVASASFPRWDRNPNTGHDLGVDAELAVARQTIFHDAERPSRVTLPVVA